MGLLDRDMILIDQFLRERFGTVIINSWKDNNNEVDADDRNWSGIRTGDSPYYSYWSQHSFGRASDKIFMKISAEEVRQDIIKNYHQIYLPMGLTCIEANVNWLHSDTRRLLNPGELYIVYP